MYRSRKIQIHLKEDYRKFKKNNRAVKKEHLKADISPLVKIKKEKFKY